MSMSDPIADMLTRIRNAQMVGKPDVTFPASKTKRAIADVLVEEGYCISVEEAGEAPKKDLVVKLKYFKGRPVIETIDRVSKPGLRIYRQSNELPRVEGGLGVVVVSTNKGMMTDHQARKSGLGGEVICTVS